MLQQPVPFHEREGLANDSPLLFWPDGFRWMPPRPTASSLYLDKHQRSLLHRDEIDLAVTGSLPSGNDLVATAPKPFGGVPLSLLP